MNVDPQDFPTRPLAALPPGSCDCHVHLFDAVRFPFAPNRSYTPGQARVADLLAFEARLGIERIVLVQPSVYGTDNAALLAGLHELGLHRARGVAVIDPRTATHAELQALHDQGVRGIRLNLQVRGERDLSVASAQLQRASDAVAPLGWAVQIYADLDIVAGLAPDIARLGAPVVLDHFAGARAHTLSDQQAAFATVVDLVKHGNAYVKLSAPYRASRQAPLFDDLGPIARALIDARPDRMLWASDWPHTGSAGNRDGDLTRIEPFRREDAGAALNQLLGWTDAAALRQQILVDNPARLYRFTEQPAT
ncbi:MULTISPECIES: amidohydrolase family protein [unclassified Burkholderia]|uniref:amidohydrolase family protein n=1 Tax=unclassified Burkholderia TaxID=2613784 RepID=UPI000F567D05|nr:MULTISPECIES: amidohydrolase family protein [unclassified Burkholderia]RQR68700.1 hydrolase [Burkholderia sp. Bp9012]RQR70631.1 hydrolase [Burkholderia sp. Bp9011]RQR83629.1 hydrolase [Burkholderia sp. Bp9010]RQZ38992.1 hydrolase [Burkholderia sp. Bp9099]